MIRLFAFIFLFLFYAAQAVPLPVEFMVDEWARARKLVKPVHLTFDGAILSRAQSTSTPFTQECFLLPSGNLRIDLHVGTETLTFVRNREQGLLLVGKNRAFGGNLNQSLRFFSLAYPQDLRDLLQQLGSLGIFSGSEIQFLEKVDNGRTNPNQSVALSSRIKPVPYGKGRVAHAFQLSNSNTFGLDTETLFPVMTASASSKNHIEVAGLKTLETENQTFPEAMTFFSDGTVVSLTLKDASSESSMNPQWLEIGFIVKNSTSKPSPAPPAEQLKELMDYLMAFY